MIRMTFRSWVLKLWIKYFEAFLMVTPCGANDTQLIREFLKLKSILFSFSPERYAGVISNACAYMLVSGTVWCMLN